MIDNKQFRVGNIIGFCPNGGEPGWQMIKEIRDGYFYTCNKHRRDQNLIQWYDSNYTVPIPITPVILKGIGFEIGIHEESVGETFEETLRLERSGQTREYNHWEYNGHQYGIMFYRDNVLKYLHQLQNYHYYHFHEEIKIW